MQIPVKTMTNESMNSDKDSVILDVLLCLSITVMLKPKPKDWVYLTDVGQCLPF